MAETCKKPTFSFMLVLSPSSVASPICQEGQSEKKPSRFLPFLLDFSSFFPIFPDFFPIFLIFFPIFWQIFAVRGGTLPPCHPCGYATGEPLMPRQRVTHL